MKVRIRVELELDFEDAAGVPVKGSAELEFEGPDESDPEKIEQQFAFDARNALGAAVAAMRSGKAAAHKSWQKEGYSS